MSENTSEYSNGEMDIDDLMNVDENEKVDDEIYTKEGIFVNDDVNMKNMNSCNDVLNIDDELNIYEESEYGTNIQLANDKTNLVSTVHNKHVPHVRMKFDI